MEEFLAAVLARAACLLAGALIGRLIRAFLAMPSPSVLLAEAGDGRCRPARLQCPVADLLADQRYQTPVRPWVSQIRVRWVHCPLLLCTREVP